MDGYTCTKACTISGVKYAVGDGIPSEVILPNRVRALTKQGYISPIKKEKAIKPQGDEADVLSNIRDTINVPIVSKGETTEVSIHPDDITAAIYIVQLNGDEAIESIKTVEKKDVLLLVGVLDRRNTVKEAAKARTALLKDGPGDA